MAGRRLQQADLGMLQARVLQRNGTGEATLVVPLTVEHIEQDASSVPSLNATAGLEACTDPQAVPTPLIVHGDYYEVAAATGLDPLAAHLFTGCSCIRLARRRISPSSASLSLHSWQAFSSEPAHWSPSLSALTRG